MPFSNIDKPSSYFNTITYTGTGSALSVTGTGFKPDFVWIKCRSVATNHYFTDVVRGTSKVLYSNSTAAEATTGAVVTSFDTNGFSLGTDAEVNGSTRTYVAWNWLASNTSGSSNTSGTITSTVAVNTTAGFSIVSYTGTGSTATVGHGLGVAPKMIIVKSRSGAGQPWHIYTSMLGSTKALFFDTSAEGTSSAWWNNTSPTSSVFTVNTSGGVNGSGATFIAYCFAEVKGFSKFGSYTGNGSTDGTFIYTGFKPAFFMVKRTDTTGSWIMVDNKRNTSNPETLLLFAHSSNAEENTTSFSAFFGDFLSNGIKLRDGTVYTGTSNFNVSGGTYIYMAFAENPFVSSKGIPCTAR